VKRAIFFGIIAALLLVPWAVAYAYDDVKAANASTSIEPADPALLPSIHIFGNARGSISAGDLFTIDNSSAVNDAVFTLLLVNIDELVKYYRYMTLNIGLYVQSGNTTWEKMTELSGEPTPQLYITMQGGALDFTLPGNARYKVTVESGSYHSFSIGLGQSAAIPQFSLSSG
jgi:hypothetical protein